MIPIIKCSGPLSPLAVTAGDDRSFEGSVAVPCRPCACKIEEVSMLDLIGTILVITAITVILMASAGSLPIRVGQRIWLAGVAGAWIGSATATAATGVFATVE